MVAHSAGGDVADSCGAHCIQWRLGARAAHVSLHMTRAPSSRHLGVLP